MLNYVFNQHNKQPECRWTFKIEKENDSGKNCKEIYIKKSEKVKVPYRYITSKIRPKHIIVIFQKIIQKSGDVEGRDTPVVSSVRVGNCCHTSPQHVWTK